MKHLREALIGAEWFTNQYIDTGEVWREGETSNFCVCIEFNGTNYCFRMEAKDIGYEWGFEQMIIHRLRLQLIDLINDKSIRDIVRMSILL